MKSITREEFFERMHAIQRARRIFFDSGLTNNITTAFQIYQEVFAEREREIFLSTVVFSDMVPSLSEYIDKYERPKCPDCNTDMQFRRLNENPEGIKVQLVCSNESCDTVLNSENDLEWWMEKLKNESEQSIIKPETKFQERRRPRNSGRNVRRKVPRVR
jgi:hypothetical protein